MTTDAEDRSTWPLNGQLIGRHWLLGLIEKNGGPEGLDLRGAWLVGGGREDRPLANPIDLSAKALEPLAAAYRDGNCGEKPPWIDPDGGIDLCEAQLQGADLMVAKLQGARLWRAKLQGTDLRSAKLQGARLWRAKLQGANLMDAKLPGADLSDAQLHGASLMGARLQGAYLAGAQLQGADLRGAQLQGADLRGAQVQGADLRGAQLQGVNMYVVRSLDGSRWYNGHLQHTQIKRESLGAAIGDEIKANETKTAEAYHEAKEAYLLLKNNFNQIGRYEDASWAYVKEQQMEKMAFHWEWREHESRIWNARGAFWRWLRNWAYELLTGYGEHPWRPALWAVLVVGVFTAVYAGAGNIAPDFAGDPAVAQGSHHPLDALTHSIGAFATIGFNALEPLGRGARLLTAVESALGIGLFALFIFTIGNRMSRG